VNPRLPVLALAALMVVIGCATYAARTADDYDQGQAPRPQFVKDNEACARQAEADQRRFGIGGEMDPTHATFNRMYDACMRASGYQRKQKEAK
jgi:hypothetical protein